jgi:hypothetical protein
MEGTWDGLVGIATVYRLDVRVSIPGKAAKDVKLTTYLHLVLRSRPLKLYLYTP